MPRRRFVRYFHIIVRIVYHNKGLRPAFDKNVEAERPAEKAAMGTQMTE
jgi:hypothetical protein